MYILFISQLYKLLNFFVYIVSRKITMIFFSVYSNVCETCKAEIKHNMQLTFYLKNLS